MRWVERAGRQPGCDQTRILAARVLSGARSSLNRAVGQRLRRSGGGEIDTLGGKGGSVIDG